jgi:hypothetical protein
MIPIVITFLTYKRTDYALQTLESVLKYLHYDGDLLWYVADGGSPQAHFQPVVDKIKESGKMVGGHSEALSPGANWNKSIVEASRYSPLYFRLEDDFELLRDFDLTPYANALQENWGVGMIRLGYLPVGLVAETIGYLGKVYFNIQKSHQYCYAGHPFLAHNRLNQVYGFFKEGLIPGDTELEFDGRLRTTQGPMVWYPAEIAPNGPFAHIGTIKVTDL